MLDRVTIERAVAVSGLRPVIIALSGGGDSTALMHLLAAVTNPRGLHVVVVDHALRPGSAEDAARAASFAAALDLSVEIATLAWSRDDNHAQQAARSYRYAALCEAARRMGARVIVTGHTRDDQAETVLLRAERGSGWRGLAGMRAFSPAPIWPEGRELWLARPLLGARRSDLRTYLRERGAAWIDDPANANDAYARVRARRTLGALETAGFDPMRLAALAERLAPHAEAFDTEASALIARAAFFLGDTVVLARASWNGAARQRALAVLVTAAGGGIRVPSDEQVAALDAQMLEPGFKAATLAGAVIATWKGGWRLHRDKGALAGRADGACPVAPLPLLAGRDAVWDARLRLSCAEPAWSVVVEEGRPVLARGNERRPIDDAFPHWLLQERTRHLLGVAMPEPLQLQPLQTP